jgi:hypothetical protein
VLSRAWITTCRYKNIYLICMEKLDDTPTHMHHVRRRIQVALFQDDLDLPLPVRLEQFPPPQRQHSMTRCGMDPAKADSSTWADSHTAHHGRARWRLHRPHCRPGRTPLASWRGSTRSETRPTRAWVRPRRCAGGALTGTAARCIHSRFTGSASVPSTQAAAGSVIHSRTARAESATLTPSSAPPAVCPPSPFSRSCVLTP